MFNALRWRVLLSSMLLVVGVACFDEEDIPKFKFSADELLHMNFPPKSSNDLDLDPCKAGKYK